MNGHKESAACDRDCGAQAVTGVRTLMQDYHYGKC